MPSFDLLNCTFLPSAVDGGWGSWLGSCSDACTVTCGGGTCTEKRSCNNPTPKNGGKFCSGEDERRRECNEAPCPGRAKVNESCILHYKCVPYHFKLKFTVISKKWL